MLSAIIILKIKINKYETFKYNTKIIMHSYQFHPLFLLLLYNHARHLTPLRKNK